MLEKKYKSFLNIIIIIIIFAIIVVVINVFYEYVYLKRVIESNASDILEAFDKYINDINNNTEKKDNKLIIELNNSEDNQNNDSNQNNNSNVLPQNVENRYTNPENYNNTQKEGYPLTYGGYGVLGKIELPKVGLKYPVLETLTDANAIDVSVAMQYGVGLNQIGNTVIMGHNYRNGSFFGSNKKLSEGDKVYITDNSGLRVEYTIYKKYLTPEADYSYAQRDTSGKREITLVTCHTDNRYRLIILAKES